MNFFKKTTLKLYETYKRPWCLSQGTCLSYSLSTKQKWHSRMKQSGREEARAAPCCPILTWKRSSERGRCKPALPSLQRPMIGLSQCVDERGYHWLHLPLMVWKLRDGQYAIWTLKPSSSSSGSWCWGGMLRRLKILRTHPLTSRLLKWRCHLAMHRHPCY